MNLEQMKKWVISQLTTLTRFSQSLTVLEVKDVNRHSHSKLFEVGPAGVGVLGHPFLGPSPYSLQE